MSGFLHFASLVVGATGFCLLASAAGAEICPSGAYLYDMIDTAGTVSDRMTAILRRNSPETREMIGGAIPFGESGILREGNWIVTFYTQVTSFSVTKSSNPSSNWRNDETVFFMDGYAVKAKFDLLALSSVNGHSVEYDLLRKFDPPPDQILLTFANFKESFSLSLQASLFVDPSGDTLRVKEDAYSDLLETLKLASGAWVLAGCSR